MSTPQEGDHDDLTPSQTAGYKVTELKSVDEYKNLDANDESLNRWKASLGLGGAAVTAGSGPKLTVLKLYLQSDTLPPNKSLVMDPNDPTKLEKYKKEGFVIKEGIEYSVAIIFKVHYSIITGVRYMHVVKRSGLKVDRFEHMLGSYAPSSDGSAYTKEFEREESPSGLLARSGTYLVRSRVVDDDGHVYCDFEWTFKIAKEW